LRVLAAILVAARPLTWPSLLRSRTIRGQPLTNRPVLRQPDILCVRYTDRVKPPRPPHRGGHPSL